MICSKCIYNESIPGISFNEDGVCNYCLQIEALKEDYGTGTELGKQKWEQIVEEIKLSGKNKQYDCVIGLSGGTDSSYLLMKACDWGLRPLAVHYDNTWNAAVATENIRKITTALNVDLHTHVINNKEHDAIKLAYVKSGVQEFDTDTDLAFVQVLRKAAAKHGVRYILEGHSFIEEGISPASDNYFDGGYIQDIVSRFSNTRFKTYPHMSFFQFLKWLLVYQQKFIRPLWYLRYSKSEAQKELSERTGWKNYKGHHLENRASAFAHTIWIPQRFNMDYRILTLAAKARNGQLSREAALEIYNTPLGDNAELLNYVLKRLDLSHEEFRTYMSAPKRNWRQFKTYKKRFETLRPLFYLLAKANRVPMSFYLKYCFPITKKS